MRKRIILKDRDSIYHCMSRTVHGERWFTNHEKAALQSILWRVAEFSGVRILTYCIMSNHFHVLVEVPRQATREALSDAELLRRYRILYDEESANRYGAMPPSRVEAMFAENGPPAEAFRERLKARMNDLSIFMEAFKNRFTRWYNHRHKTFGTLWSARFKSVWIERLPGALRDVAAYIDLNPVRAGLVNDPAHYAFSGFGQASLGYKPAYRALAALESPHEASADGLAFDRYTVLLYTRGTVGRGEGKRGVIPATVRNAALRRLGLRASAGSAPSRSWEEAVCRGLVIASRSFFETQAEVLGKLLGLKKELYVKPFAEREYCHCNRRV